MKPLLIAALLAASTLAYAQSATHQASGTVTKVDKEKVTIKHGPVPSLNWPGMTMAFKAQDKKVLDKVKVGEKLEFSFVKSGNDYIITQVK